MRSLITLLTALAIASPATAQDGEIEITPVAEHLFVISGAIDLIVASVGDDGVLLVDAGYPETADGVRDALRSIGAGEPDIIINTHYHHAFANASFSDATIIAHEKARERMRRDNTMAGRTVPAFPADALPEITFSDSLTIHFNGDTIDLVHMPEAHTDGDIVVFFGGSDVVATGDVFVPHLPWTDYEAGGRFEALPPALDRLIARVPEGATIVPGHDHPVTPDSLIAFREAVAEAVEHVEARLAAGDDRATIVEAGLPAGLAAWEGAVPGSMFLESVARGVEATRAGAPAACRYVNGRWYDDGRFIERTMSVENGVFVESLAGGDCEVDLAGGWVVPGFGDAHRHDMNDSDSLAQQSARYLDAGVFYVMEQDPIVAIGEEIRDFVARPETVDVAYTQGVVSPSWGFITSFYGMMAGQGMFGDRRSIDALDGREIFVVDDAGDLDARWDDLAELNDVFIKVILAFSEEFDRRSAPDYEGPPGTFASSAGLDPELLPDLVARAHEAGLRVSVHVETAADFRAAVDGGADLIAHLPGAWQIGEATGFPADDPAPWMLTDDDARRAAERGVGVITTIHRADTMAQREMLAGIHRHNLELLNRHDVPIVIGSDGPGLAAEEARYIASLDALEEREVLEALVAVTPRTIFPDRRIGALEPGYEASFVVLAADPLVDLSALSRISMRVKQGFRLPATTSASARAP